MHKMIFSRTIMMVLVVSLMNMGFPVSASAGLIGTGQMIASQEREATIARINSALQSEHVEQIMTSLGVDSQDVQTRLAGLTQSELQQIDQEIVNLPAGGSILVIIGAVFIVLLILELVGITDVFSKI